MSLTAADIIRAAIPDADARLCEHILWGRTPFPCGRVDARGLYRAASSWRRAVAHDIRLCDMCDRIAMHGDILCRTCDESLKRARR